MKIAIEAQRIFRKEKHGMDYVALEMTDAVAFKMRNGNDSFAFGKDLGNNDFSVETSQSLVHGLVLALFFF